MSELKKVIQKVLKEKGEANWGEPIAKYNLTFDSQESALESVYYWILDFINNAGWKTKKIVDNFTSSPGSGSFSEMGQRSALMQDRGIKILGDVNTVIKSTLNLIYDLKEFEIRLSHYEDYRSKDENTRYRGMLALKQIWIDNVDMKKGNGSINVLAGQAGFVTLRDLFFTIETPEQLKKIANERDGIVNEQTSRIITPRLDEFWKWIKLSENELRKRFSIEKNYLKSQVETIKLYSQWMKPYIKAAQDLRQKGFDGNAALVHAFSTSLFELELFAKKDINSAPDKFNDPYFPEKNYQLKRPYHPIIVINIKYRGHVSQRVTQKGDYGFAMGGRMDIEFECYALNGDELKFVEKELEKQQVEDSMDFSTDVAAEALKTLSDDLDHFLNDDAKKKEEVNKKKEEVKNNDINPFSVIFRPVINFFKGVKKKVNKEREEIKEAKDIPADNFVEKEIRAGAASSAADFLYAVYDVYKKSHGMSSSPTSFENADSKKTSIGDGVSLKDVFKGTDGV